MNRRPSDSHGRKVPSFLLLTIMALSSLGCVPGWVKKSPADEKYYYGLGSAGQSYNKNPAQALRIARERALIDLAMQLRVQVTTSTTLVDSSRSSRYELESVQFTDEELENVANVDSWVDRRGRAGPENQTYVLVRLSRGDAKRLLNTGR